MQCIIFFRQIEHINESLLIINLSIIFLIIYYKDKIKNNLEYYNKNHSHIKIIKLINCYYIHKKDN